MRVLHVYSGNLYGGIERFLATLAHHRGLCREMEPSFALCWEGRLSQELRAAGAPVHLLGGVRVRNPFSVWRGRRRLAELLRRGGFDAAICHSPWPQALFAPVIRSAGVPLVFWLHGPVDGRPWLERWAKRTPPDLSICNSRFVRAMHASLYPATPAQVIYYPVAAPESGPGWESRLAFRKSMAAGADSVVIVQASRMEEWKGQKVLLSALGGLKSLSGWLCWLAGGAQRPQEAAYLEELKRTAEALGIADRVRFLGERADVERLLAGADIFCQANAAPEPFGIAFVEALHAGLPVIASDGGGAGEIVDRSCGILVKPGDPGSLGGALDALIQDPALRARLGKAGPARAREICDPAARLGEIARVLGYLAQPAGLKPAWSS